jgi:hypothetical protein
MNKHLVNSIIQVIRALPKAEQQLLIDGLNQVSTQPQPNSEYSDESEILLAKELTPDCADEEAWQVWQSLGDDALPGHLKNSSIHHDQYLYLDHNE